jgi:hypothetical protein
MARRSRATETVTETETPAKKIRKLDIAALREKASELDGAEGEMLTKRIDAFVEASEARKIAGKKLRQALAFLQD